MYGKTVDMWAMGVICYILLGGYPPFHDDNSKKLFAKIKHAEYEFHPEFWGAVSGEAKNLIAGMLTLDTGKRLTVDQALAHKWVNTPSTELAARNLAAQLDKFKVKGWVGLVCKDVYVASSLFSLIFYLFVSTYTNSTSLLTLLCRYGTSALPTPHRISTARASSRARPRRSWQWVAWPV